MSKKLKLNKETIANLTTEEMMNTIGGHQNWSSTNRCCGSQSPPSDSGSSKQSSDRKCCDCSASVAVGADLSTIG